MKPLSKKSFFYEYYDPIDEQVLLSLKFVDKDIFATVKRAYKRVDHKKLNFDLIKKIVLRVSDSLGRPLTEDDLVNIETILTYCSYKTFLEKNDLLN